LSNRSATPLLPKHDLLVVSRSELNNPWSFDKDKVSPLRAEEKGFKSETEYPRFETNNTDQAIDTP